MVDWIRTGGRLYLVAKKPRRCQAGSLAQVYAFSLFARKYLRTRADGQLAHWKESIEKLDTNGVGKKFSFLRPYQKDGVAQLHALHQLGCHPLLADEMGLGKTMQTLALVASSGEADVRDLVICPASVVPVWQKEAKNIS